MLCVCEATVIEFSLRDTFCYELLNATRMLEDVETASTLDVVEICESINFSQNTFSLPDQSEWDSDSSLVVSLWWPEENDNVVEGDG